MCPLSLPSLCLLLVSRLLGEKHEVAVPRLRVQIAAKGWFAVTHFFLRLVGTFRSFSTPLAPPSFLLAETADLARRENPRVGGGGGFIPHCWCLFGPAPGSLSYSVSTRGPRSFALLFTQAANCTAAADFVVFHDRDVPTRAEKK